MADLTLHLSPELSKKLASAAIKEAKEPEMFVLDVLERVLEASSLEFIGAWKDSDIAPEDILGARAAGVS